MNRRTWCSPTSPMGRLKRVLRTDALHIQAITSTGYHLYYPNPRQQTPAFALLVERCATGAEWEASVIERG